MNNLNETTKVSTRNKSTIGRKHFSRTPKRIPKHYDLTPERKSPWNY